VLKKMAPRAPALLDTEEGARPSRKKDALTSARETISA
jgi:hypothetical protein